MFSLRKTTGYALLSLAYMAERPGQVVPAREIAEAAALPLPLLMKLLKVLHHKGLLSSCRGTKGGYKIATDLQAVSLYDLVGMLQSGLRETPDDVFQTRTSRSWLGLDGRAEAPLLALQYKLVDFLESVKLADLVLPGRRIDVPLERVRVERCCRTNPTPDAPRGSEPMTTQIETNGGTIQV